MSKSTKGQSASAFGKSVIIAGHRYYAREWFSSKAEAQKRAVQMRKTGQFLGVRVVRYLRDRRYPAYWVFNR